jgi:hypothetical protein
MFFEPFLQDKVREMRNQLIVSMVATLAATAANAQDGEAKLDFHGAGWLQSGRVESSWETPDQTNDYKKNWVGQTGALLTTHSTVNEHWEGQLGLGTALVQLPRGARGQAAKWYVFPVSWVDEANIGYKRSWSDDLSFRLTLGSFHYGYNSDIKNFGQYLMQGYVYPGTVEMSLTGPLGVNQNLTGLMASFKAGAFKNDLIVNLETEDKPLYDISIGDVVSWKIGSGLEVGAGVNFYRFISADPGSTAPKKDCDENELGPYAIKSGQKNACYIIDSIGVNPVTGATVNDTILVPYSGIKLMGRVRIDPKAWLGQGNFGKNDLVVYSEFAVIGLKDYPIFYDNILRRIPIMFGFNLPGFNWLDISVELQYYASKISGDNLAAQNGSPLPWIDARLNSKRDDWKYSLNVSKVLAGHVALLGQVANDDLRLGGYHDEAAGKEAMRVPTDWYWTTKIAYFF